jgi:hypothetical protein
MRAYLRLLVTVSLLFTPFPIVAAQKSVDAAGRWEGTVTAGDQTIPIAFDIVADKDKLSGTFSGGPENVTDLALSGVTVSGRKIRIGVPAGDAGEAVFEGVVADDGATLKGEVLFAGQSYPFSVKRTASKLP